jgi:hypothetical protein
MTRRIVHDGPSLTVIGYRCTARPSDRPFAELHERSSLSFVRTGSFGCRIGGQRQLAPQLAAAPANSPMRPRQTAEARRFNMFGALVLPPRRSDPVWRRAERSWQGAEPKA